MCRSRSARMRADGHGVGHGQDRGRAKAVLPGLMGRGDAAIDAGGSDHDAIVRDIEPRPPRTPRDSRAGGEP